MTGYIATVRRQGTLQGSTHYRRPDYSPVVNNTAVQGVIRQFKGTGSRDRLFLIFPQNTENLQEIHQEYNSLNVRKFNY
jgi:hypothetical protein